LKISQNFTRHDIIPSDAELNWAKCKDYDWLFISDGLNLYRNNGHLRLVIDNSMNPRHLNRFSGNLFNNTTGVITPITTPMKTEIYLNPKNRYTLIVTQTYVKADNKGLEIDTLILNFEPEV
jgi:hypothetical protein